MSGCYGNSQEDEYYERMLDKYLDGFASEEEEGIDDPVDDVIEYEEE